MIRSVTQLARSGLIFGMVSVAALLAAGGCATARARDGNPAALRAAPSLLLAAERGDEASVRSLLRRGADVDGSGPNGATPLMAAAQNGFSQIAELLLKSGANVRRTGAGGRSALMFAAHNGHEVVVQRLLHAGADVNQRLDDGRTPLMMATIGRHSKVVALLLRNGCEIDARDRDGTTALIFAAGVGDVSSARALVEAGANTSLKNNGGWSALSIARDKKHEAMLEVLRAGERAPGPGRPAARDNRARTGTQGERIVLSSTPLFVASAQAPSDDANAMWGELHSVKSDDVAYTCDFMDRCERFCTAHPGDPRVGVARQELNDRLTTLLRLPDAVREHGIMFANGTGANLAGVRISSGTVDLKKGGSGVMAPHARRDPPSELLDKRATSRPPRGAYLEAVTRLWGEPDDYVERAVDGMEYQRICIYQTAAHEVAVLWYDRNNVVRAACVCAIGWQQQ